MTSWAKMSADLDSNPKIRRAGRDGREVFLFVLRRNAALDLGGRVPKLHVESWYLADQLMCDEVTASHGLSRAVTAGLLRDEGDEIVIVGWDDEWGKRPLTEAERQAKRRAKLKGSGADSSPAKPDVTKSHAPSVTCPDSHGSEEKREEEKKKRAAASSAPPEPPESALARGTYAKSLWQRVNQARKQIAHELGIDALPLPLIDGARDPQAFRDLRERLREEGENYSTVGDHVLANLIADAREKRSLDWLGERGFTRGGWATARRMERKAAKPPKRQGPAPSFYDELDTSMLITLREDAEVGS